MSASLLACDPVEDSPPDPEVARADIVTRKAVPNRQLDLLFVIDDSASTADKQAALQAAFPAFLEQLATLDGGLPDLHLGVVSTDVGTLGRAVTLPGPGIGVVGAGGCAGTGKDGALLVPAGAPVDKRYVEDAPLPDGSRRTNYTGSLGALFRELVDLGSNGCGFEQPLHAMRRALDHHPANTGFLRADANLAVIVLADEDDCSMLDPRLLGSDPVLGPLGSFRCFAHGVICDPDEPTAAGAKVGCRPRAASPLVEDVAPYIEFLTGLKADPRQLLFGAIAGPATEVAVELRAPPNGGPTQAEVAHACRYTGASGPAVADPAVRLAAMVAAFPAAAQLETVCNADVAPALAALGRSARELVGDPCLGRLIADLDATAPGVQPDCVVVDAGAGGDERALPACGGGKTVDCWQLVEDAFVCRDRPQQLRLEVVRSREPAADAWTTLRCVPART